MAGNVPDVTTSIATKSRLAIAAEERPLRSPNLHNLMFKHQLQEKLISYAIVYKAVADEIAVNTHHQLWFCNTQRSRS